MSLMPGAEILRRAMRGAENGVQLGSELVHADSQDGVPVESGALKASARIDGAGLERTISYNTEYAAAQHEQIAVMHRGETTYLWQVHNSSGRRKFLEDALKRNAGNVMTIVAGEIRKALGG